MTSVTDVDLSACVYADVSFDKAINFAVHRDDAYYAGMIEGARLMKDAAAKFLEAETLYWPDPAFGALLVYTKQIRALDPEAIVKGKSDGAD